MTETLMADLQARTVKGMLLPWNEASRPSNIGIIEFARGILHVPRDPSIVTANLLHKREQPVGRATALEDTDAGLVATFAIADTPEGDQLLLDISEGRMKRLSAEVKDIVRKGTKALAGTLFGAAFVPEGAFESASLYAELATTESHSEDEYTDENGVTWRRVSDTTTETEAADDGSSTKTTVTTVTEETTTSTEDDNNEEATVSAVPNTLEAAAATPKRTSLYDITHALALFGAGDRHALDSVQETHSDEMLFAALNDVKAFSTGSVGINIIQPQWIGELWEGRSYQRRVIPLINHDTLTSYKVTGYKWTTKPTVGTWAGDKSNVPSNSPATEAFEALAIRYAGGHDIAREFRDFGVSEFWDAYFKAMTDSYAKKTDDDALAALVDGATVVSADTVPTGFNKATSALIDGAASIIETGIPSFALVGTDVWKTLLKQNDNSIIGTLSLALGLEDGTLSGFRLVPSSNASLTGKVLVGARNAATTWELPGSPIRTEALDQIKGGLDEALFGYALTAVVNEDALSIVTVAS